MRIFSLLIALFAIVCSVTAQNVGIGTTTPEVKLHVVDVYDVANGSSGAYINVQNATNFSPVGTLSGIRFRLDGVSAGTNARYKGGILFEKTSSFGVGSIHFATNATGDNSSITTADAKMTITSAGNVGIGTTSPGYKLQVTGGDLFVQSSSGTIRFGYNGSNQWKLASTGGGADLLWISSPDGTTDNYRHYFSQNGYVGLGTGLVAPVAPLHVKSTAGEVIRVQGSSPWIRFEDNTDGYTGYLWYNGTDMVLAGTAGHAMRFVSNGGYKMTINTDGRVSVGSSNLLATGYLLNVDGKIIGEELKVQLSGSWPDYVFRKDYNLMSIEELEKSIKQNNHLPNIPSAADITADKGFEVGEMNRKLLEKVEELTLYIIDANKKIKLLEDKVGTLENKTKQ